MRLQGDSNGASAASGINGDEAGGSVETTQTEEWVRLVVRVKNLIARIRA